jgi:alpha,alpha-trehalose phosphorylase
MAGTYLAGVHELRTLVYPETAAGDPEATETLVDTINGTLVRLLVDGQPLDVRTGELRHHERVLDLRDGTLRRHLRWSSPAGRAVEVRSERLVSLELRTVAAVRYTVRALEQPVEVVLQSSLVANEQLPQLPAVPDPEELLRHPLEPVEHEAKGRRLTLVHRTSSTDLLVGAMAEHELDSPAEVELGVEGQPDHVRLTASALLEPGQHLTLVKLLGYAWSDQRGVPAVRDELSAALTMTRRRGFAGLLDAQRARLDEFWECADVDVDGDPSSSRPWVRAVPPAAGDGTGRRQSDRGQGADGHRLRRSRVLGHRDVRPARADRGPARGRPTRAGLAPRDVAARPRPGPRARPGRGDVPAAHDHREGVLGILAGRHGRVPRQRRYRRRRGPVRRRDRGRGLRPDRAAGGDRAAVALARPLGARRALPLFGVTGPDEYSALGDDNVYTNVMAQRNLRAAVHWARRLPADADRLGVVAEEAEHWATAAERIFVPYDDALGVHPQSAGYLDKPRWDFAAMAEDSYPLHSRFPYVQLYRKQVVKQADLVLALFLRGDAFTDEEKARDFAYYEELTVRDSSLSACCQAIVAAEVGHLELAHEYVVEAALADLRDAEHDSSDGLHVAALAGTWLGLVAGFGGLRQVSGEEARLSFRPALPPALSRLRFRLLFRGGLVRVTVQHGRVTYELVRGEPLRVWHEQEEVELTQDTPVVRPTTPRPQRPTPLQPETRATGRGTPRDEEARSAHVDEDEAAG